MTADISLFEKHDKQVREFIRQSDKKIFRIMGGPHPTYSPEVIDKLKLDAICQGDGDQAFPSLLKRLQNGESIKGIPNIGCSRTGADQKELFDNLDNLPFADRDCIFEIVPYYKYFGHRTFNVSRGCPYHCTYCFNHAYNKMLALS